MEVAHYNHDVDSMIQDIFHHWDINNSGYIEKAELKQCCSDLRLSEEKLAITFNELDLDGDGKISLEDFANSFQKVCSLFDVTQDEVLNQEKSEYKKFEKLLDVIGVKGVLSGQEYVSELFHYMHNSNDSAQLLSLLESFLFSVVRDVKHYSSENAKLEEALKRACEKHAEHMEQLDDELDQQMSRLEMRIKKEEQSKFERSNLDMVWQLETKNKEIQALNAKVSKLENKIKKKEPEEQKLKEEIEEKVQELRYLRSQVTDAQTTVAVIRSELAQLKNDYEDQSSQLEAEKRNVMECVQEQESLTRQLQLLHEANKKLHDTNDDLRSALEMRRGSEGGKSPSPSKRNSISTLYSTVPRAHRRSKSHEPSSRRASNLTGEFSGDDRHPNSASASTPRSSVAAPPPEGSRRSSMLLPTQQSCEVDDPVNEDSLLSELMKVQRSHNFPDGTEEEDEAYSTMPSSERESLRQQLDLLQKTNNDLRTALEVVGKTRSPSSKGKRRSERGEKCRRNASIKSTHSDYGSISSRSMSPSRSHGAKSGEDIADGAEELSGYDPESDGNNTSTITLQSRHEEAPPIPAKLGATQHERIKIAGRETNDVIWEDEDEAETERPAGSDGFKRADDNSPFKRNSILRKPCRHRSLETLDEGEGPTGRGNRSAWPPIARAGKWHSMEQVKRRNDFAGERTRSLPHLRTQSADRLDFSTGEGLTQLAEKLNALQKSAEDVKAQTPPNKVTDREAPAPPVPQEDLTSAKSYRMEEERRALREIIAPLIRPVPAPRTRKSAHVEPQEDQTQQRHPVIESPRHTSKTLPRGSVVTRIKQSESLPDSDLSRADISELEAQFKSVIKEDEEDIDEDDVDDEELAQLVAMATGLTDSEEETETEDDDTTVGVREAAVGADSISEASTNTALNMSNVDERVPERMFKIVLAGDAAVGKSSFILRLCRNRFHSALNSTLGVDFQMKTLVVDGKTYALQLWDTAGQERFRSIAKSYFRKADGVLLLYDVTCETSFLDVRDWVEAIEESCSKPVPIMLCGNKIDIRQSAAAENKTVITAESGSRLAKEHGALFIETSSKENKNIAEACIELARMLRDVEDIEVKQNNGMKLTDNDIKKKKTNCCST
ncbi:ras and EF-hand domain-containing protein isoform X12 [Nematostella vectensis]|uniref:ras and EF-hand domain-containing protein isoform X12 n=1 Tax=Nematostella vectensis TaxID=45351 RepID=UPI0020777D39|nr:ras and EF-hand domain-containing protein isoform X12 [Nematostella vectensis]